MKLKKLVVKKSSSSTPPPEKIHSKWPGRKLTKNELKELLPEDRRIYLMK